MIVSNLAVVGSGTMGSGLAALAAARGVNTTVLSRSPEMALGRVMRIVERAANKSDNGPKYVEMASTRLAVASLNDSVDADLVVECLPEDLNLKREWFRAADTTFLKRTVFASNTSCLPLEPLFGGVDRPWLGTHFFNPIHAMRLVEVAPSPGVSRDVLQGVVDFLHVLGKEPVIVPLKPGYVVNRMIDALINRAAKLLDEPGMDPEIIDKCVTLGANHPMGPLKLADLIGIDTLVANLEALFEVYRDPEFAPAESLKRLRDEGRLGRKTGEGFFVYP